MALFNLQLNIPEDYKKIINKYLEILAIAMIYIICMDADSKPTLLDQTLYIALGIGFHCLIVQKIIKIV